MNEIMKKKIIIYLILLIMLFIWWRVEYKDTVTGFYEQAVEAGENAFTASISDVRYIVMTNNDISLKDRLDTEEVSVAITIWSDDGEYYEADSNPLSIHTNGYTSTESTVFDNLPFSLTEGKEYNIAYSAKLSDGTSVDQLSFLLYSDYRSIDRYSIILMIIIAIIFALMIFTPLKFEYRFALVWLLMLRLVMIVMPGLLTDRGYDSKLAACEREAFANSYSLSAGILGKDKADEQGYVYIEESGIRNLGYTTYRVPLIRFWLDNSYGNYRSEGNVSSLFKTDNGLHILSLPSAVALTVLRTAKAGYKGIIIGGWLINALITFILAFISMKIAPKHKRIVGLVMCLPSSLMIAMSYTGMGIILGVFLLIFAIASRRFEQSNSLMFVRGIITVLAAWAFVYTIVNCDFTSYHTVAGIVLGLISSLDRWLFTIAAYDYESLYEVSVLPAYLMVGCLVLMSPLCYRCSFSMSERRKKALEAVFIGLSCLIILIRYNQF